jgi:chemotaxis response regulator CheB
MPGSVARAGLARAVLPLGNIARAIDRIVEKTRS